MSIKTFVFLDCETTGLPAHEYNKTKITELCLISCQADNISLGVIPRVKNKLNLCFNPLKRVSPFAEELTGLYNDELANESSFDETSLSLIGNFLRRLSKPICFVAHNGNRFDYPILRNHIEFVGAEFFPDDVYCVDSILAFKQIHKDILEQGDTIRELCDDWDEVLFNEVEKIEDSLASTPPPKESNARVRNETTPKYKTQSSVPGAPVKQKPVAGPSNRMSVARRRLNFYEDKPIQKNVSFKLGDVYERIVQKPPQNAHEAEADVNMLIEIVLHLGEQFVNYANNNMILFNRIPKMETGKKIGLPDS